MRSIHIASIVGALGQHSRASALVPVGILGALALEGVAVSTGGAWQLGFGPGSVVVIGLLGMVSPGSQDDPVERLAETVERFQEGEVVEFETDRDDEVGRLAKAIDDLIGRVDESELEAIRERMEFALQTTDSIIFEIDFETNEETRHGPFERLYGVRSEEVSTTRQFHKRCVHPDDRARVREIETEEYLEDVSAPVEFEYRTHPDRGPVRWLRSKAYVRRGPDGGVQNLVGLATDITERKERERELERTRGLLEQAGRVAEVGGWEVDARVDPPEMTWSKEVYDIHELPPDETVEVADGIDFYHPEDRPHIRESFERALDGEEYDVEARLITAEGNERWVHSIGVPVREDGEVVGVRGSIQDITDQKERELALESLHEGSRSLLETETREGAAEVVVETGTAVLDVAGVGLYLLEPESSTLEAAASTPTFRESTSGAPPISATGQSPVWDCFVTGETRILDAETDGRPELFGPGVRGVLLVPVGNHGVFVVTSVAPIERSIQQLAETLVATAEAAFDRIESERTLKERDAELEARTRQLGHQIQITDIIRRIDRSLVGATSRSEMETAVCEGLVEAEAIGFAWIGEVHASGDAIEPRVWAGDGEGYLDAVSLATDVESPVPAAATATTGDPTVVGNVADGLAHGVWRKTALEYGFHSVVSVPLVYEDYFYGVLTVYIDEVDTLADLDQSVFVELGETIAHSINAVETRRALYAETMVELTLELDPEDDVLGQIARRADCHLDFAGVASHSGEETRLFVRADADAETIESVLDDLVVVQGYRLVEDTDDSALFEITVGPDVLVSRLIRHGGTLRSIHVSEDRMEVVADVPTTTDVRAVVEMLRETVPSVELLGRRRIKQDTLDQPGSTLLDGLTDRQRDVLRTAHYAGFFEWPRTSTGEDVADMLDLSQPTVSRHLRLGQRYLFAQLFDRDVADARQSSE